MSECTCQESWESYLKHSKDYSFALQRAKTASLRWIKTTDKKFNDAWKNYDEHKKNHQKALDKHLEARTNCPEHGLKKAIG